MCQSKANGGKRCTETNGSNYPHILRGDEKTKLITLTGDIAARPELFLHAALASARTGYPLSPQLAEAIKAHAAEVKTITPEQSWEQWKGIANAPTPSAALKALYESGLEEQYPELAAIRGVEQSPFWHPEGSVEKHTAEAADVAARNAAAANLSEEETTIVVLGALCHDFGKSVSTHKDEDGKINSHGHEHTGRPIAKRFLRSIGADAETVKQVGTIVKAHMHHTQPVQRSTARKLVKLLEEGGTTLKLWGHVAEADTGGRGTASTSGISKQWNAAWDDVVAHDTVPKKGIIHGGVLSEMGLKSGLQFAIIVKAAKEAQENGEFTELDGAKAWVNEYIASGVLDKLVAQEEERKRVKKEELVALTKAKVAAEKKALQEAKLKEGKE